jgi:hypothetical protein
MRAKSGTPSKAGVGGVLKAWEKKREYGLWLIDYPGIPYRTLSQKIVFSIYLMKQTVL